MNKKLNIRVQKTVQIMSLGAFVALMITSKVQLWLGVILIGMAISLIFGRVYCGWICPINTAMKVVTWIKNKIHYKGLKTPTVLTSSIIRYGLLLLFMLTFAFVFTTGKKLPVLPFLFLLGVMLTLIFPEEVWHRYLCPYGTLMKLPALKSRYALKIEASSCNGCGLCERLCPAKAVTKVGHHFEIEKSECLICQSCKDKCKRTAIHFKS